VSIYVEILIRAPMDVLWAHTQTPALHERWDLRFSRIDYLPRALDTEPQRFRYTARIAFGVEVSGEGETAGQRDLPDGSRSSALRFGSDSALSIIREGSGYWKYIPAADGIRFLTRYDYRTRVGPFGTLFDRLIFRPLIGWATAWSFDRLRGSMRVRSGSGSRCCSAGLRTSGNGTTTPRDASESSWTSGTEPGDRCLATAAASTSSGET
jgi:hypothetical protein